MKKLIQSAWAGLLLMTAFTACVSEKTDFGGQTPVTLSDTGYVAFSEEGLSVITDAEVVRATSVDVDTFLCTIVRDDSGETVQSFTYGERPTSPIELQIGAYTLHVSSGTAPAVEWESPVYGATVPFTVQKDQTNTLDPILCKLSNIKVTVGYDADLYDLLESGSQTEISIGESSIAFAYTEERAAYFAAPQAENTMKVDMSLTYAGKSSKMSATIEGVKAGQWRKITVNMPHVNEGNVVFTITVETFLLDEEIVVDLAEVVLAEAIIPDDSQNNPYAPIIAWEGHNLKESFQLKASHFDADGNCTLPVAISVDANESTFTAFVVNIASTSSAFMESLLSMNFKQEFDLCQVTASSDANLNTALTMVGIPTGSKVQGKSSVSVDLTSLMAILYQYDGTHDFTMTVTNAAGHAATATLSMVVNKSNEDGNTPAPEIVWVDHDIKQAYVVTEDLQVKLEVSAPAGIADMTVDIVSDVLTEEALDGLLPTHIDLVNPGDTRETLEGLGFPTAENVKDKTAVSFDISDFMGALIAVSGGEACYANFVLTVKDNGGQETAETLQLLINQ